MSTLPDGFTVAPEAGASSSRRARDRCSRGRRGRLGARRGAGLRLAAARGHGRPPGRPGHAAAARSASATPSSSTTTTGAEWTPLAHLDRRTRRKFWVYDSLLSEYAALGFEYGYSVARPGRARAVGGAVRRLRQRRADRSSTSSSSPPRTSGASARPRAAAAARLRGPGPRALVGRIERFLTLCAEDNIQVANAVDAGAVLPPAAPAGATREPRKPLIVFTPKSLLRLQGGGVAGRRTSPPARSAPVHRRHRRCRPGRRSRRVVLCSGKVYYDLLAERRERAGRRPTSRSSGSSSSYPLPADEIAARALGAVPASAELRVGAGGAGQPGRRGRSWRSTCRPTSAAAPLRCVSPAGVASPAVGLAQDARRSSSAALVDAGLRADRAGRACTSPTAASRSSRHAAARSRSSLAWLAARLQRVRRPQPRLRDPGRAAGHLAGPPRRRGLTRSLSDLSAGPVRRVEPAPDAAYDETAWPFALPPVRQLLRDGLDLPAGVTFLVGENGSGKSTLVEAIAMASDSTPSAARRGLIGSSGLEAADFDAIDGRPATPASAWWRPATSR